MRNLLKISIIIIGLAVIAVSCAKEQPMQPLFNGTNLDNWDKFLGSSLGAGFDSLAQAATTEKVFSVVEQDGVNLIRISGEINGSLATQTAYENYHLRLVFKWGETVYSKRNSGLLYHSFGDFGAAFGTWMANIECQLMHQNLGDTYLMVNTVCETAAVKTDSSSNFVFTPAAELTSFGETANGRSIKKSTDVEMPLGEWNTVDLYCFGTTAVHVVNGITVMVNKNTGTMENGIVKPLQAGKIQLQSEGGELFVKTIEIQPIRTLPENILSE